MARRTAIEMFQLELEGKFGPWRQQSAVEQIKEMEERYEKREYTIENGAALWECGNYLPMDCLVAVINGKYGHLVDVENHERLLDEQNTKSIQEYKERMKNHVYSEEELFEMRAAFGEGVEVVDVISGNKIRL